MGKGEPWGCWALLLTLLGFWVLLALVALLVLALSWR
jgi:hypothetical protein